MLHTSTTSLDKFDHTMSARPLTTYLMCVNSTNNRDNTTKHYLSREIMALFKNPEMRSCGPLFESIAMEALALILYTLKLLFVKASIASD